MVKRTGSTTGDHNEYTLDGVGDNGDVDESAH